MSDDGLEQSRCGLRIAETAVRDAFFKSPDNRWRRREIHVRNPQGENVAASVAVPLERITAAPVDDACESVVFLRPHAAQTSRSAKSAVDR
jgi:hypothetical protein